MQFRNKFKQSAETVEAQKISPSASTLLEPKVIEINGCKFIISKMPCTVAQEVIVKLPGGFIPMISNFTQSEEMAFKMLSYCERVYPDGKSVPLISKEIIDNHVPNFDTFIQLEKECIDYNYSSFLNGEFINCIKTGVCLVETKLSGILTDLLDKLSQAEKLHTGD